MKRKNFLIFLGLFALSLFLLVRFLPNVEEIRPYKIPQKELLEVSTLSDHGSNSLREAISEANRGQRSVTIQFKVSGAIILETPLPSLLNDGTMIKGRGDLTIDASRLSGDAFIWTVKGTGQTISGLTFYGKSGFTFYGKGNKGVLVIANKGRIERCKFEGFDTAITLGGNNNIIDSSIFRANKRGIDVMEGVQFAHILSNEIKENYEAGIWGVWPRPQESPSFLRIEKNHISGSPSGIILFVEMAEVKKNIIVNNTIGIYLLNSINNQIAQNEIYQNREHGIMMEGAVKNRVAGNNIYQNGISGLMMKGSGGNMVFGNMLSSNGLYGAADMLANLKSSLLPNTIRDNIINDNGDGVYIQASSPILKGNTIKQNHSSGIRIMRYVKGGKRYDSHPLMDVQETIDSIIRIEE